jgi:predicted dehydrogenase
MLGIGIIGSGFMGRTYAETIAKYCSQAQVRAVTGGSRAGQLAADYGLACEPSVDALLARPDVAAVFITTPHHVHAEQALAAARAGKHVMLEKPMACTVAECDAIIEACREAGVQCSVGFTQRHRKCNLRAKELLDSGQLGRVRQIMEWEFFTGGPGAFPQWQSDPHNLGVLFGYGVHNLDRIRWLTGSEIATVYAKCRPLTPGSAVEGSSMLIMTLTDGATACLWNSAEIPPPGFPRTQFSCWLVADRGLVDLDSYGELRVAREENWEVLESQEAIDWKGRGFLDPVRLESFARHANEFLDALAANRPCPITGWDGRQAVAAALAAYESARTGREVRLAD